MPVHHYHTTTIWTGNLGKGTSEYKGYDRAHTVRLIGKPDILGSSDAAFRGDKAKHTPEELFVSSLSTCHMLWYLHLCSVNGVVVIDYVDHAGGVMEEDAKGSGRFTEVTLNPRVTVKEDGMIGKANELHHEAHKLCFIANSVNFPVLHKPTAVTPLAEKISR